MTLLLPLLMLLMLMLLLMLRHLTATHRPCQGPRTWRTQTPQSQPAAADESTHESDAHGGQT